MHPASLNDRKDSATSNKGENRLKVVLQVTVAFVHAAQVAQARTVERRPFAIGS